MDFPLLGDDPTEQERQMALANALRRQQTMGMVGQITGDPVLSKAGAGLVQNAEQGQQQALGQQQHRLQLAMAAQKDKELQQYRTDQLAQHKDDMGQRTQDRLLNRTFLKEQQDARIAARGTEKAGDEQKALEGFYKHVAAVRGNPIIVENTKRLNAAQRAMTLGTDEKGQPRDLSPQFYREFVTSVANTIAPGSTAEAQIEALAAQTLGQKAANWKQYILGHPEDAGVKEFVRQGMDTLRREHGTIKAQNLQQAMEVLPFMAPTLKRYPQAWNAINGFGITQDMVDPETFLPLQPIDPIAAGHAAEAGASSGMVDVVAPDGTHGQIPAANLQKALTKGYQRAGP